MLKGNCNQVFYPSYNQTCCVKHLLDMSNISLKNNRTENFMNLVYKTLNLYDEVNQLIPSIIQIPKEEGIEMIKLINKSLVHYINIDDSFRAENISNIVNGILSTSLYINKTIKSSLYSNIACLYIKTGLIDKARVNYELALKCSSSDYEIIVIKNNLARLYLIDNKENLAEEMLDEVFSLIESISNESQIMDYSLEQRELIVFVMFNIAIFNRSDDYFQKGYALSLMLLGKSHYLTGKFLLKIQGNYFFPFNILKSRKKNDDSSPLDQLSNSLLKASNQLAEVKQQLDIRKTEKGLLENAVDYISNAFSNNKKVKNDREYIEQLVKEFDKELEEEIKSKNGMDEDIKDDSGKSKNETSSLKKGSNKVTVSNTAKGKKTSALSFNLPDKPQNSPKPIPRKLDISSKLSVNQNLNIIQGLTRPPNTIDSKSNKNLRSVKYNITLSPALDENSPKKPILRSNVKSKTIAPIQRSIINPKNYVNGILDELGSTNLKENKKNTEDLKVTEMNESNRSEYDSLSSRESNNSLYDTIDIETLIQSGRMSNKSSILDKRFTLNDKDICGYCLKRLEIDYDKLSEVEIPISREPLNLKNNNNKGLVSYLQDYLKQSRESVPNENCKYIPDSIKIQKLLSKQEFNIIINSIIIRSKFKPNESIFENLIIETTFTNSNEEHFIRKNFDIEFILENLHRFNSFGLLPNYISYSSFKIISDYILTCFLSHINHEDLKLTIDDNPKGLLDCKYEWNEEKVIVNLYLVGINRAKLNILHHEKRESLIHLDLFFDSISFGELFSSIQDDKGLSHLRFSIKEESKQSILDYVPCIRSSLELHFGKLNFIQLCSLTSNLTLSVTVEDKWSDAKFHISYFNGFNHCIISNGSDMSILEEDYILTKLNFSYEFYKSYLSDREKFCLTSLLTLIESCPLSGIQKIKSLEGKVQFHLNQTEYLFNLRVLNCNFLTDFVIACLEVKSNGKRYFKYYSDFLDFDTGSMLSAVSKRRILKKLKPISKSQIDRLKDIIERDTFKYLIECEVLSILHEKHNYDKVDHLKRIINFL